MRGCSHDRVMCHSESLALEEGSRFSGYFPSGKLRHRDSKHPYCPQKHGVCRWEPQRNNSRTRIPKIITTPTTKTPTKNTNKNKNKSTKKNKNKNKNSNNNSLSFRYSAL